MSETSDAAVLRADEALRNAVALVADDHLDLAAALAGAQALQSSIVTAFERRLRGMLPQQDRPAWLDPLLNEVARSQCDLFVMRAALAKHGQAVPAYRDALVLLREILVTETAMQERMPFRASVDLGPTTMGYGWHAPERSGTNPWYRWSGPSTTSGLLVPTGGAGRYRITIQMQSNIPENVEAMRIRVNGIELDWKQTEKADLVTMQGSFAASPEGAQRFFALVEWEVPRCLPLSDFGGNDHRRAGFSLSRVIVELHDLRR